MRDIHSSILAELESATLRPFYLFNMTIEGTTYRLTDCDIPLYFPVSNNVIVPSSCCTDPEDDQDNTDGWTFVGPSGYIDSVLVGSDYVLKIRNDHGSIPTGLAGATLSNKSVKVGQKYRVTARIGADSGDDYMFLLTAGSGVVSILGTGAGVDNLVDVDETFTVLEDSNLSFSMRVTDINATAYIDNFNIEPVLGDKFSRRGIRPDPASYGLGTIVDKCTIEIDNVDQYMTSIFVGSSVQGSDVGLRMVVLDEDLSIIGGEAFTLFSGEIDSWELDPDDKVVVTMANIFTRWNQMTLANHSSSCRWKVFKGAECGYVGGATECDRTYVTCHTLGNSDNFGGFRWLPSLQDAVIWWGRSFGEDSS